jgi:hypothetical protein
MVATTRGWLPSPHEAENHHTWLVAATYGWLPRTLLVATIACDWLPVRLG